MLGVLIAAASAIAQELPPLIPIEKDGKWGYCNANKELILEPSWDFAWPFYHGLAAVEKNGKKGYIAPNGKVVIKPEYDLVKPFTEDYAFAFTDGSWYLINSKGKRLSNGYGYIYDDRETCGQTQLFKVYSMQANGKAAFGWINRKGREVIAPQYSLVRPFSEGYAAVQVADSLWGFIDSTGSTVVEPQFYGAHPFNNGIAQVAYEPTLKFACFVNALNSIVSHKDYSWRENEPIVFSEGLAAVRTNGRYVYVDESLSVVLDSNYTAAGPFEEGVAIVKRKSRYGLINRQGEEIIPIQQRLFMPFCEGVAAVAREEDGFKNMGYVNRKGETVIDFSFKYLPSRMRDGTCNFSEGRAVVPYDTGKGVIDSEGNELVAPTYQKIKPYVNGWSAAKEQRRWAVLNKQGEQTTALKYSEVDLEAGGPPRVMHEELVGMVNMQGREVLKPKYQSITWMGHNLLLVVDAVANTRFYVDVNGRKFVLE